MAQVPGPIGITGAEFRLGFATTDDDAQGSLGAVRDPGQDLALTLGIAVVNVAITEHHGLQGDLNFEDTAEGALGRIGGHLFLTPNEDHKYGVFGVIADVDDEGISYALGGVEGLLALNDRSLIELRAGLGIASEEDLDLIFLGAAYIHEFRPGLIGQAGIEIAEFDELNFSAIGTEYSVGLTYQHETSPWGAFGELVYSDLTGTDAAPGELSVRAGVRFQLGQRAGITPATRYFRTPDPVAQLLRRGLF